MISIRTCPGSPLLRLGSGKRRRSSSCGFLNRAAVVVLVPGKRCPSGKRFLAIGVGTFVRSVARVGASVSRQRAAVAESLLISNGLAHVRAYARATVFRLLTYLGASLTVMRFFSRVDTLVNGQGRSLDELLAASREIADVRSHAAVYPFFSLPPARNTQESTQPRQAR